jgi:hypothetical protein
LQEVWSRQWLIQQDKPGRCNPGYQARPENPFDSPIWNVYLSNGDLSGILLKS